MGADSAVHLKDPLFDGLDASGTAWALAAAIKPLGADLILTGQQGVGTDNAQVPGILAEILDLPQVTFASVIETQGDQVRIKRDGDTATEVIGGTMPLVLSVTDQTGEARYPSFKGIMAAKSKPVTDYTLADLGIDPGEVGAAGATTEVVDFAPRPPRQAGQQVKDPGDGSAAVELAEFLAGHKFI